MKTMQCNIRMTEEFLYLLQDQADLEGITVSEYVRTKLSGVIARQRKKASRIPIGNRKASIASVSQM